MSMALFHAIRTEMCQQPDVAEGKMMSSEAITYKGKVFAFQSNKFDKRMCFRLGRDADLEALGVTDYALLNPFKNKPPMKDWFLVDDEALWPSLAEAAKRALATELDR